MPDQGTVLRTFMTLGIMAGAPLSIIAYGRLRRAGRNRLTLLVLSGAALLCVVGLAWLLVLTAPPGDPCPPTLATQTSATICGQDTFSTLRDGPIINLSLIAAVTGGLAIVTAARQRQRQRGPFAALLDDF